MPLSHPWLTSPGIQKHPSHRPFPVIQHTVLTSASQTTAQTMKTLSLGPPMCYNFMCLTSPPPKARIALLANTLSQNLKDCWTTFLLLFIIAFILSLKVIIFQLNMVNLQTALNSHSFKKFIEMTQSL